MTLREAIKQYAGFPPKENFDFPVESIGPYIILIASNYKREENRQSFTIKIRYGVNMFSDYAGRVGFRDGLPGRLYKAKIDVTVLLDDGNKIGRTRKVASLWMTVLQTSCKSRKLKSAPFHLLRYSTGRRLTAHG